jgi:hypothetical protein
MDATTLAPDATRYLEAIDLFRSLGLDVKWRSEDDEVGAEPPQKLQRPPRCRRCAGPLVRLNGQHVCFRSEPTTEGAPRCQR